MYAARVMRFRVLYNQAVPVDGGEAISLGSIVDDILGLPANEQRAPYMVLTHARYESPPQARRDARPSLKELVRILGEAVADLEANPAKAKGLIDESAAFVLGDATLNTPANCAQLRATFERAATEAADGRLSPELAPHLARVRRLRGGVVEVEDFVALAAWALEEKLRDGPVQTAVCPSCGALWLPERHGVYCQRPLFSCRANAKQQTYRERHGDFQRERKKLYERARRGTLSFDVYDRWLEANRPGPKGKTWVPFDKWQGRQRPKKRNPKGGSK